MTFTRANTTLYINLIILSVIPSCKGIKKEKLACERRLESLLKKLNMINLKADNAIRLIEDLNVKIDRVKDELQSITKTEAEGAILRSKVRWVEHGERSSKYFLNLEKFKSKAKAMTVCTKSDGSLTRCSEEILKEQKSFYAELYTKDKNVSFQYHRGVNTPVVNDTQQILLNSDLTEKELGEALRAMANKKSPGIDGLPADFYKVFWSRIQGFLYEAFQFSLNKKKLYSSARNGMITLIPKKGRERTQIRNWRPITLLNVDYKIYSKAMANRIKLVLPDLIHEDQTGFMAGRNIAENIRKVIDLIEYTYTEKIPALVVQIDYLKAFDRADYQAIWRTLSYFGFEDTFLDKIKILFQDVSLCTTNNGYVSEQINPTRGLFQGNPIAPYIFLLLIETLSIQLRNAPEIKGINVEGVKFLISQFADDMNLFIEFREEEWIQVMNILDWFEISSGMRVSYEKTSIYRIGSLQNTNARFYSRRKVHWTNEPINVLGIWVSNNTQEMVDLNVEEMLKKAKNLCYSWRYRDLSLIGKAVVLSSLVVSLFVYKLAVLPMLSKRRLTELNEILVSFVYRGKRSSIAWPIISGLKINGGLGVPDIMCKEKALKVQWVPKIIKLHLTKKLAYALMGNPIDDLL